MPFTAMFSSLVAADGAPYHRADDTVVSCVMASGSPNNSSLNAALGMREVGHSDHGKYY
jgi:hypothetical protein